MKLFEFSTKSRYFKLSVFDWKIQSKLNIQVEGGYTSDIRTFDLNRRRASETRALIQAARALRGAK